MPPEVRSVALRWHRVSAGIYFATTTIGVFSVELEVVKVGVVERSHFGGWWWEAWEPDLSRNYTGGRCAMFGDAKQAVRDFFARRRGGEA